MSYIPEQVVEELAESINSDQCDAVFLSCTDMATLDLIESLEKRLGKPVISSMQATIWGALRAAGIDDKLEHRGCLLSDH